MLDYNFAPSMAQKTKLKRRKCMEKKIHPIKTKAQTFILESLDIDDEKEERLDGKILYDVLRLQGKIPIYYYFRTQSELVNFAKIFRDSGYRYLHLSCHGNNKQLYFTFGPCDYQIFADIFKNKLNNRRLFIAGCSLGNIRFAQKVFDKNPKMYSITAPIKNVFFSQTASFWPAFYFMMHAYDSTKMKTSRLSFVFTKLTEIFEMPLVHYHKNIETSKIDKIMFDGKNTTPSYEITKDKQEKAIKRI
jgi:hypothetical protein